MLPETTVDSKAEHEAVSRCDIRLKVILYTEICMYLLSLECPSPLLGGIRKESWEPRFLVCCDPITRADSKQVHTQTFQRVAEKFPAENSRMCMYITECK